MTSPDFRGEYLRLFDSCVAEFTRDCAVRFEGGTALAALDVQRLAALAKRLTQDITDWSQALKAMDLAVRDPLPPRRAAEIVVECVFDDSLNPAATRVLTAAIAMSWGRS